MKDAGDEVERLPVVKGLKMDQTYSSTQAGQGVMFYTKMGERTLLQLTGQGAFVYTIMDTFRN